MNIFKRLFKIGEAETNSAIDKMEDPIKMTEQGIRDMKTDLEKSIEALAQVKALAIRSKNEMEQQASKVEDYHNKAILILNKVKTNDLDTKEGDRLAKAALEKKEMASKESLRLESETNKLNNNVSDLERNINEIKSNINQWENELKTLKARVKVSKATKNLNKQMAELDNTGTVSMLERMKEKVEQEEALAEAYGDINKKTTTIDEDIDKLIDSSKDKASSDLDALKQKLGIKKNN
jgi:phage shock protein A